MTIGPEPITITFLISVRLGIFVLLHHFNKLIEKVCAIAGPGALVYCTEKTYRHDTQPPMSVQEVVVGALQLGRFQRVGIHSIAMVLARNLHTTALETSLVLPPRWPNFILKVLAP